MHLPRVCRRHGRFPSAGRHCRSVPGDSDHPARRL